jgi:hypothetical protein
MFGDIKFATRIMEMFVLKYKPGNYGYLQILKGNSIKTVGYPGGIISPPNSAYLWAKFQQRIF